MYLQVDGAIPSRVSHLAVPTTCQLASDGALPYPLPLDTGIAFTFQGVSPLLPEGP